MIRKASLVKQNKRSEPFVRVGQRFDINAEGVLTLDSDNLLSDAVVEGFIKTLLKVTRNKKDERFLYISSHAIVHAERSDDGSRSRLKRFAPMLDLHMFDKIMWPIHKNSHCMLCVGDVKTRNSVIIDPYRPKNNQVSLKSVRRPVLAGLTVICFQYDAKYDLQAPWSLKASFKLT